MCKNCIFEFHITSIFGKMLNDRILFVILIYSLNCFTVSHSIKDSHNITFISLSQYESSHAFLTSFVRHMFWLIPKEHSSMLTWENYIKRTFQICTFWLYWCIFIISYASQCHRHVASYSTDLERFWYSRLRE